MSLERLDFAVEVKASTGDDPTFHYVEGYASTFGNIDRHDDVIVAGAFAETITAFNSGKLQLSFLWQHNSSEPVGSIIELREDPRGLWFKAQLPKEDDFVKGRVMPQIRARGVNTLSIGFMTRDRHFEDDIRFITKLDLWEISLATIAANTQAVITGHKSVFQDLPVAAREHKWVEADATERVGDRTKAFLDFGEVKLLIADVIDEELVVVPTAVFKAAAVVNHKAAEEGAAVQHIERYYKKMGLDSPFGKSFRVDDWGVFSTLEKRCQERLLHEGIRFGGGASKALVALLEIRSEPTPGNGWGAVLDELKSIGDQ